jgi:LysM repeat protein
MVRKIAFLIVTATLLISSCSQATNQATITIQPTGALTPYQSPTATVAKPTATIQVTIPVTTSPTATPFLHTITSDDTMLSLAFRYGVSLQALKTANPTVNPNAMTVGSQLVIPISTQAPQEVPTATPVSVQSSQPRCTLTGDGGAWCIVPMHNDHATTLENISVWIGLYDALGKNFSSQIAYAPMNILRPGSSMPMMAYFTPPLPPDFTARAELLTAESLPADDSRYLDVEVKTASLSISPDGSQAQVSGEVILPAGSATPSQIWVLAVAYAADGSIIGARKWKSAGDTHFDITVYSLGGSITTVDLLCEVTP